MKSFMLAVAASATSFQAPIWDVHPLLVCKGTSRIECSETLMKCTNAVTTALWRFDFKQQRMTYLNNKESEGEQIVAVHQYYLQGDWYGDKVSLGSGRVLEFDRAPTEGIYKARMVSELLDSEIQDTRFDCFAPE